MHRIRPVGVGQQPTLRPSYYGIPPTPQPAHYFPPSIPLPPLPATPSPFEPHHRPSPPPIIISSPSHSTFAPPLSRPSSSSSGGASRLLFAKQLPRLPTPDFNGTQPSPIRQPLGAPFSFFRGEQSHPEPGEEELTGRLYWDEDVVTMADKLSALQHKAGDYLSVLDTYISSRIELAQQATEVCVVSLFRFPTSS